MKNKHFLGKKENLVWKQLSYLVNFHIIGRFADLDSLHVERNYVNGGDLFGYIELPSSLEK